MKNYFFTSESVTEGHPDKVCDYISDSILDECLKQDENSRVAVETMAINNSIIIAGQISSNAKLKIDNIARDAIKKIGYDNEKTDIDYRTCNITKYINIQSENIALGIRGGAAGDQGIMFGYACNETETYMPYAIFMAHKLAKKLTEVRKSGELSYLRPDGKTQVTVEYENDIPKRIEKVLISTQHEENVEIDNLKQDIYAKVIKKIIPREMIDNNTKIYINPAGKFVVGGPLADTGLTGRKIIVDTYGGYARHGGGAFSGKDSTKVDRSASYMLRHIAKNIVANKLAKKCEIQVSYAIGIKKPLSVNVNTFGTSIKSDEEIIEIINNKFNLTPNGIIDYLKLRAPIYRKTTNYGHFGKDGLEWEKIIKLK